MKFIKIQNEGLLDIKLVPLMGGTTKKDNQYKIGQFGTGLKYALDFLVRNKIEFKIFIGIKEVKITTVNENIAGQEFTIIYINGERTSITAQMGYDWNHWMIIREIWCNALDEGGAKRNIEDIDVPFGNQLGENQTTFYIEYNLEFAKIWQNWSQYFLQEFEPMFSNDKIAIYPGTGKLRLFKQGVLIHTEGEFSKPSLFNYDIKDASINELREFKGNLDYEIMKCITSITDNRVITYFLENVTEEHFEGTMDYFWTSLNFNNSWKTTIGTAKLIHQEAIKTIKDKGLDIDLSSVLCVPKNVYKVLVKAFEGIGALRTVNKVNEFYEIVDAELELQVKQALVVLEECGYFIHPELKFVFGVFGDKTTLAQINTDKKEILVSERMKGQSLFQMVAMLIEENEHFATGFQDHTREFQQHFINLYTKTMLSKNKINI